MYRIDTIDIIRGQRDGYHDRTPVIGLKLLKKGIKLFDTEDEATLYLLSSKRPRFYSINKNIFNLDKPTQYI